MNRYAFAGRGFHRDRHPRSSKKPKIWAIKNCLTRASFRMAAELRFNGHYPEGMVIIENLFHFRLAGNPEPLAKFIFGNMSDSLRIPFFLVISAIAIGVVVMIFIIFRTDKRYCDGH